MPLDEPAVCHAGDRVAVTILAKPRDDLIAWTIELASGRRFRQTTWQGMPLAPEDVRRSSRWGVPRLNRRGRARAAVLSYCDGRRTVREIEDHVLSEHPNLFASPDEASRFVAHVLKKDTE
jgi:protein arginine N-methyltransferase 1